MLRCDCCRKQSVFSCNPDSYEFAGYTPAEGGLSVSGGIDLDNLVFAVMKIPE